MAAGSASRSWSTRGAEFGDASINTDASVSAIVEAMPVANSDKSNPVCDISATPDCSLTQQHRRAIPVPSRNRFFLPAQREIALNNARKAWHGTDRRGKGYPRAHDGPARHANLMFTGSERDD